MSRTSQISAGLLVYRRRTAVEVLLGHPGGPFWSKKDIGAWTIPKGVMDQGEDHLAAALREFREETNLSIAGKPISLKPVNQKSGKTVHGFAVESDLDLNDFASNTFEMEWPPRSGRQQKFPEIDRIAYFVLPIAMTKIIPYQQPFLRELAALL
jgi:predicted NUDIX family NTP pyrophosphohydrolase